MFNDPFLFLWILINNNARCKDLFVNIEMYSWGKKIRSINKENWLLVNEKPYTPGNNFCSHLQLRDSKKTVAISLGWIKTRAVNLLVEVDQIGPARSEGRLWFQHGYFSHNCQHASSLAAALLTATNNSPGHHITWCTCNWPLNQKWCCSHMG